MKNQDISDQKIVNIILRNSKKTKRVEYLKMIRLRDKGFFIPTFNPLK